MYGEKWTRIWTQLWRSARELGQQAEYVKNVVQLLDEGNTIPFIARYRKELHGAMDDTTLRNLETKLRYLAQSPGAAGRGAPRHGKPGEADPGPPAGRGSCGTLAEVEDLYRPYRPKRRTRATVAREKGLEPLAAELFRQDGRAPTLLAKGYINPELGVETVERRMAGASDILAEEISDDAAIRKDLRQLHGPGGQCSPPGRPLRRPTVYTGCTMTSPVPPPSSRVIRSWPSTAGKGGLPEALPGPAWGARGRLGVPPRLEASKDRVRFCQGGS